MAFSKGKPKTGGRAQGTPNKTTHSAKAAFQYAFAEMGGNEALAKWGNEHPSEFYRLYGRLIPLDHNVGGQNGNPIMVEREITDSDRAIIERYYKQYQASDTVK